MTKRADEYLKKFREDREKLRQKAQQKESSGNGSETPERKNHLGEREDYCRMIRAIPASESEKARSMMTPLPPSQEKPNNIQTSKDKFPPPTPAVKTAMRVFAKLSLEHNRKQRQK
jgi:hypothetical protein